MASILASAAKVAHHAVASALAHSPVKVGDSIPDIALKTTNPETADLKIHEKAGKVIILGVPGAFTPPCSNQIPGYIKNYDAFVRRGFTNIYVVAVNDAFVVNAWKDKLAPEGTKVEFVADDQAQFVSALGLVMDATPLLGGPRSKRFVIVAENGKVLRVQVEDDSSKVTVTEADKVLGPEAEQVPQS